MKFILVAILVCVSVFMFGFSYSSIIYLDYIGDLNFSLTLTPIDRFTPVVILGTLIFWDDYSHIGIGLEPYVLTGAEITLFRTSYMSISIGGFVKFSQDYFFFGFNSRAKLR